MGSIPEKVRQEVAERSGGRCECIHNDGKRCSRPAVSMHHLKFLSRLGKHIASNILHACMIDDDIIHRHFWKPGNEWAKKYRVL